ncbi:hypothetical protein P691DRAFT_608712, partial [Macrolepiota fuliginosa MF-IS2]
WSFQKLTWNNYYTWSKHMKTALEAHQLWWGYVERERPPPKKPPVEPPRPGRWDRYRDWVRNDRAAMGLMKCALDPSQWPYVQPATTSKEMWD